ncbi:MAG TPA: hydrogenase maturation nickel metallochaperone HypA [Bacteroidales bacterium]|nr:hydrogenase maturation nickel metallochaperone HypA [Bacteroidales bacterium]HOK75248.1 hydrogenase maturation nickel metallochaperone HypA [Bacteroidales bacterium]HOM41273.1 hydrogenase maturation nickel metallochaperone HypA [Bacteroidales bacterium]HPP93177.1 hydrogenase maturation nickel metallochaperone HypA [Bacteroidales bacterium]HRR16266.1 hydrogenase maturation nickel metallochaperone HypA [Bacteroidales bacterium]
MHELGIAENLVSIVLEVAGNEKLTKVTKVNVSIGEMSQVVPDLLETAFQVTVAGTIAENAELEMEIVPVKLKCMDCDAEFEIHENIFVCENCGSQQVEIISGTEMFVKSIEGE